MTKKKKKKESWKEKRRRAAQKRQKALEAERLKREREPKKTKEWSKAKIFGVAFMFLLIIGIYGAWQHINSSPPNTSDQHSLYHLTDAEFSEFRGKVVLIDCFATYCQPCITEIPYLAEINNKYNKNEVVVVSVGSSGNSPTELEEFKQKHDMTWTVARDTVGVFDRYSVEYIPTLVILDQSGSVHFREAGLTDAQTLSTEIDALLGS